MHLRLEKRTLSQYLRLKCERFLYYSLHRNHPSEGIPLPLKGRPGIGAFRNLGLEFESSKFADLSAVFEESCCDVKKTMSLKKRQDPDEFLSECLKHSNLIFLIEPTISSRIFAPVMQEKLGVQHKDYPDIADLRPDLIQIFRQYQDDKVAAIKPDGSIIETSIAGRSVLRVIDLKAAEKVNASYAAEVIAYSMALASWIEAMSLDLKYIVSAEPAVWTRNIKQPSGRPENGQGTPEKLRWVEDQIEIADVHLYGPSVIKFFTEDIPLIICKSIHSLDWGVQPTCSMCDFLGYPAWSRKGLPELQDRARGLGWSHEPQLDDYCYTEAKTKGLAMQIPSLSTGMRRTLAASGVGTLEDVSSRHIDDPVFSEHNGLKIESSRLPAKADAIINAKTDFISSYRSASMAAYSDITITINVSFDAASGLLIALGLGMDFNEASEIKRDDKATFKEVSSFLVDEQTIESERVQILDFLRHISRKLAWIKDERAYKGNDAKARAAYVQKKARIQIFFWDAIQEKALRDAIGRHLDHIITWDKEEFSTVWLFPPAEMERSDKTADTPLICYLKDVVTRYPILPTTISDDLISIARYLVKDYKSNLTDYQWDIIGGTIPKERALEIWQNMPPGTPPKSLSECKQSYFKIMNTLVHAMRQIVFTLRINHKKSLKGSAPYLKDIAPTEFKRMAPDTILWNIHTAIEEGVGRVEKQINLTADPRELECRNIALRTNGLITGNDRAAYLDEVKCKDASNIFVFKVSVGSRFVKFKDEESFLVLLPEEPVGSGLMYAGYFLDGFATKERDQKIWSDREKTSLRKILGAALVHFDREGLRAIIRLNDYYSECWQDMMRCKALDVNNPMVLLETDGISEVGGIKHVSKEIGNPPIASPAPKLEKTLPSIRRKPGKSPIIPAARVLWEPDKLTEEDSGLPIHSFEDVLGRVTTGWTHKLNPAQREAARTSIAKKLSLVWGGPGTGKTKTLAATIFTDAILRIERDVPGRILVTALTYRALGEIITRLQDTYQMLLYDDKEIFRDHVTFMFVTSMYQPQNMISHLQDGRFCGMNTIVVGKGKGKWMRNGEYDPALSLTGQRDRLAGKKQGIEIVFAVTRQAYNIITGGDKNAERGSIELFDKIWLDESSQLAIASALPLLGLLAKDSSLVVVGDRLQMPPIQSVPSPKGVEELVGSLHKYLLYRIKLKKPDFKEEFLSINYRSCEPIVAFSRAIGYEESFEASNKGLSLIYDKVSNKIYDLACDSSIVPYSPIAEEILDPLRPCVAVMYDDGQNGQANVFEGTLVASVVIAFRSSKKNLDSGFNEQKFWEKNIGVVTPHRAQRAVIVSLLQQALKDVDRRLISGAVDTVERFQGSEREAILISFGLGDPDLIYNEEEFLFQKERINVAITRARAKVVLFVTRDIGYHLPTDPVIMESSKAIKDFAYRHLEHEDRHTVSIGDKTKEVRIRYRTFED